MVYWHCGISNGTSFHDPVTPRIPKYLGYVHLHCLTFLQATSSSTNHLCISNVPRTIHMWIYCTIFAMKSQDYRKRYEMDTRVCTVSSAKLSRVLFRSAFDTQELQQPVSLHILCCKPSRKVATSSNRYYLVGLRNLISNITAAVQLHKSPLGASFALFPPTEIFSLAICTMRCQQWAARRTYGVRSTRQSHQQTASWVISCNRTLPMTLVLEVTDVRRKDVRHFHSKFAIHAPVLLHSFRRVPHLISSRDHRSSHILSFRWPRLIIR